MSDSMTKENQTSLPHYKQSGLKEELEPYYQEEDSDDFSYLNVDSIPQCLLDKSSHVTNLHFENNLFTQIPKEISLFENLIKLDISNNQINKISPDICRLKNLKLFICRNNELKVNSIPKDFGKLKSLLLVNLSGNQFDEIPFQFSELENLKSLYLGGNSIATIPEHILNLKKLEILYLGGNKLNSIPPEVGHLTSLVSLILSDNKIQQLPCSLSKLHNLQCLSLHNNRLSTLPQEIINLNLVELSLRNNPLVVRFVQDLSHNAPSLMELAGRVIKVKSLPLTGGVLPKSLVDYLNSGHQCVNPKCKGFYFTSCVEQVKFVDFCGKYRLPLLQYLCSPQCTKFPNVPYSSSESDSEDEGQPSVSKKIKKVLLG